MLKILKNVIPAAVLTSGLLWTGVTPSYAKPKYATKEGKACIFRHVTEGGAELNDAGKYYAVHDHSLEGYTPPK
jgi:hypothetical protein